MEKKKNITKCLTLVIDFPANFHLLHDFFGWGTLNFPKMGKQNNKVENVNLKGCKVNGVFVMDKTGLKILAFIYAMIFAFKTVFTNTPFMGKQMLLKSAPSHPIFWMLQQPNIRFMTLLSLSTASSSAAWSTGLFFIHLSVIFGCKKWWTRLKFPSEISKCGKNERQSS